MKKIVLVKSSLCKVRLYPLKLTVHSLFSFVFSLLAVGQSCAEVEYTLHTNKTDWHGAKTQCEQLNGRLAVVDTAQKISNLTAQV